HPEPYTSSLHDALPISPRSSAATRNCVSSNGPSAAKTPANVIPGGLPAARDDDSQKETAGRRAVPDRPASGTSDGKTRSLLEQRSEEHTSELQSRENLV